MFELLTEYQSACSCTPDSGLCWRIFGARDIDSGDPFTFPVTLEVNGNEITFTSFSQVLPGGDNPVITAWPDGAKEYAFLYSTNCPTVVGCASSQLFLVEADTCCPGSVTISEDECDFTSMIASISSPTYQWQTFQGGSWVDLSGETGSTLTGGDDNTLYRVVVTDGVDDCVYISNEEQGDCAATPCSISCSATWNAALERIELDYNASGGSGSFDIQINPMINDNPGNCSASTGVGAPICSTTVAAGIGQFNCSVSPDTSAQCFRAIIFDASLPGSCFCVDFVLVPAAAAGCSVNIDQDLTSCTFEVEMQHPVTTTENQVLLTLVEDSVDQLITWDCVQFNSCAGGEVQRIEETGAFSVELGWSVPGSAGVGNALAVGDYVSKIQVHDTTSGTQTTLDLSPGSTPYASGCAGTINTADLTYTGGNIVAMRNALEILIENAICTAFGTTPGVGFSLETVTLSASNPASAVVVRFAAKHNPSGLWVGPDATDQITVQNDITVDLDATALDSWAIQSDIIGSNWNSPCGFLSVGTYIGPGGAVGSVITTGSTEYDSISLVSTTNTPTLFSPATNQSTCGVVELSADASGTGIPTYVWSTGETTQQIYVESGSGNYSVTVVFPDSCQANDSITL